MENLVGPIIFIVKFVSDPIVRYLKYQIKFKNYLEEYKGSNVDLCHRERDIRSRLDIDLQCPWNVAKEEVQRWLEDVEKLISRQYVEDEVKEWGCLSCYYRVNILKERTKQLREIYERGERHTNECLVIECHSKKLDIYVKNFKDIKKKLQCKQRDIDSTLQSQLGYGKMAKEEVKNWLKSVEEIIDPFDKDIEDQINKGRSLSHVSTSLTNLLNEKIQNMEKLYKEGGRLPKSLIMDDPLALMVELPTIELQGNRDVKVEILECLMGVKVTKVGVWGMGGIGKTTIMKHVYNEMLKGAKFKKLIWVTVSQTFDIHNMQEQIASSFNEQLPQHQNTTLRAAILSKILEGHKPYLLILDDVWSSFELENVGIPEPLVVNGCKLVLTTRSQEVARSMGCKRIKVKTLSHKEALKLFLHKVGDVVLLDLASIVKDIVNECDGLPLAIVTVAGSLKEIYEPRLWKAALNQLRECKRNVAGTDDDAFRILKFSYDHLKNPKIQYCFLYCAMYPEDYNIPTKEIIEHWINEGFIDEMLIVEAMKDEGYDILRKLKDNCLLESINDEYKGDSVRMHDLIRDMALNITKTSPQFLVRAGLRLRKLPEKGEWIENLEKVSLMINYIDEIPSNVLSSTCTMLTTLLLSHNNLLTISESFFENMPGLKILDLSYNWQLSCLPNSVSKLVNLTTLLLRCTYLTEVPSLSNLHALKKLDLGETKLKEIPKGLGMLTNLKYLDISRNRNSKFYYSVETDEIANRILSNLSKLQYLGVSWKIALKGEVIRRLVKLEGFSGRFPTWHDLSIFLKGLRNRGDGLSMFIINVASHFSHGRCFDWSPLELKEGCNRLMLFTNIDIDRENTLLLPSMEYLNIVRCNNLRSLNDISAIKDAINFRICWIQDCKGMEYVLSSPLNPLVQKLKALELYDLDNLDALFETKVITKSSLPPNTFSSLKIIRIYNCGKIKKLFPSWMHLPSLEEIDINKCKQMEELIAWDPNVGGEKEAAIQLSLLKLKRLELKFLPAMKSICSRMGVMVCDSLEVIDIGNCEGLRRIPLYLPLLDNGQLSPPPSLKTIDVTVKWWESLEWDHPDTKDVLLPFCKF